MPSSNPTPRPPLTRDRILQAAVDLVDRAGLGALTMRRLGAELGVEAMALYKHVANKDAILDGIVERVVDEIEIPSAGAQWRQAMRQRATSMRQVLDRHAWAIGLIESRGSDGATVRRYLDAILGNLRAAGFSLEDAAHAFWLLDSYVYGHVVQEASARSGGAGEGAAVEEDASEAYPHLAEMEESAREGGYSFDQEFAFGLELILDALERIVASKDD